MGGFFSKRKHSGADWLDLLIDSLALLMLDPPPANFSTLHTPLIHNPLFMVNTIFGHMDNIRNVHHWSKSTYSPLYIAVTFEYIMLFKNGNLWSH